MTEMIDRCFEVLRTADSDRRKEFLKGAYAFCKYVEESEIQIGNFLDPAMLDWYGKYVPYVFGQLTKLRQHLDQMSFHFGTFDTMFARRSVLLVEGQSEAALIDTLKKSNLAWFIYLDVNCYEGSGNTGPKRIEMLLQNYKSRGIVAHLQGDADGKPPNKVFEKIVHKKLAEARHCFVFEHDLETSIPRRLLFAALTAIGKDAGVAEYQFLRRVPQGGLRVQEPPDHAWHRHNTVEGGSGARRGRYPLRHRWVVGRQDLDAKRARAIHGLPTNDLNLDTRATRQAENGSARRVGRVGFMSATLSARVEVVVATRGRSRSPPF